MEDRLNYLDEKERQNTTEEVVSRLGLSHLITFMIMTCASKSDSTRYLNSTSPCLRPCARILNFPTKPEK